MAATDSKRTGYFFKRGGTGGSWKKRYFVLEDSTLSYFKTEESKKAKGCIQLTEGRGVRQRKQCKVEWPSDAKEDLCFGIATESRTYYIYATDMQSVQEWITEIQQAIEKIGKANEDWENDIEGKPESKVSKAVRSTVQLVTKITKKAAAQSGALSEDQLAAVEAAADAVENQAAADPNTNWKDRAKMGVLDGAGVAGQGLNVASEFVPNEYGQAAVNLVGGALVDQSEADRDLSATQRLGLAAGSTIQGAAGFAGDIGPLADTLDVAGGVVKDQAEADKNLSWQQRVALGVDSAASGAGELESLQGNAIAQTVTGLVQTGAQSAQEVLEEEEEEA